MPTGGVEIVKEDAAKSCRKTVWVLAGTAAAPTVAAESAFSDGYRVTSGMTLIKNDVLNQLWGTCVTAAADNKANADDKMGAICHVIRASGSTATSVAKNGHQVAWLSSTNWPPGTAATATAVTADTVLAA